MEGRRTLARVAMRCCSRAPADSTPDATNGTSCWAQCLTLPSADGGHVCEYGLGAERAGHWCDSWDLPGLYALPCGDARRRRGMWAVGKAVSWCKRERAGSLTNAHSRPDEQRCFRYYYRAKTGVASSGSRRSVPGRVSRYFWAMAWFS